MSESNNRVFDLEKRLLDFAAAIISISEGIRPSRAGTHVGHQLLRSGTAPYAIHGEAEGAESRDDFIHKMRLCYKELRESRRWLRLIQRSHLHSTPESLTRLITESDQLVRIFAASIRTAARNSASPSPQIPTNRVSNSHP